jgi:hypothetical protein
MASEYLKWKYRDIKPDEPVVMTPAEKRKNWWHYHKWQVLLAAVLFASLVSIGRHALGLGETLPDYQIAYVGTDLLPEDTVLAIERAFSSLGEDLNGDGRVSVRLTQYAGGGDAEATYLAGVSLMGDLLECQSYFFLLENPERFQEEYHSLCLLDGSLPAEGDNSAKNACIAWNRCPALAGQELGAYSYSLLGETISGDNAPLLEPLFLGRRGFWTEKTTEYPEGCEALWERLTEGANIS